MHIEKIKNKNAIEIDRQPNRIGKGTHVKGNMVSEGDFRIDGKLQGDIQTSGKVVIGKEGGVEGKMLCQNADIEGIFIGELIISGLLSLRASANVEGEVTIAKLSVEPGAIFNVLCHMKNSSVKTLNNDSSKTTEKTA
jgi:cytoskeletal protein CcmA (bactofilin family)